MTPSNKVTEIFAEKQIILPFIVNAFLHDFAKTVCLPVLSMEEYEVFETITCGYFSVSSYDESFRSIIKSTFDIVSKL